jgi:hypothetical protein
MGLWLHIAKISDTATTAASNATSVIADRNNLIVYRAAADGVSFIGRRVFITELKEHVMSTIHDDEFDMICVSSDLE